MNLEDRIRLSLQVSCSVVTDEDAVTHVSDEASNTVVANSEINGDSEFDEDLNPVEYTEWQMEYKCKILPNTSARKIKGNDGADYVYSYEVFMRKPKQAAFIPRENSIVHITKKDGTIDRDCRCIGFVTLRNWLKLWV